MQVALDKKQSIVEKLSVVILEKITAGRNLERVDYLKCKLGIETFLCNISKMSVVYTMAFLLGLAFPTFVFHVAYMAIRNYAYGAHSESSIQCIVISCIILIGIPFVLRFTQMPRAGFTILYVINHLILNRYAPAATRKNNLIHVNTKRKNELRRKVLQMNLIVFIIAIVMPNLFISNLLMFGTLTASLMTTPLAYKLLKNEWMER